MKNLIVVVLALAVGFTASAAAEDFAGKYDCNSADGDRAIALEISAGNATMRLSEPGGNSRQADLVDQTAMLSAAQQAMGISQFVMTDGGKAVGSFVLLKTINQDILIDEGLSRIDDNSKSKSLKIDLRFDSFCKRQAN